MSLITVDYGSITGGGGNTPVYEEKVGLPVASNPKTIQTKNMTMFSETGACASVINGEYKDIYNKYPTLIIYSYDTTTHTFSIYNTIGAGSYEASFYYEPL